MKLTLVFLLAAFGYVAAQRITTIQLDGVQYFVSRMNPYSPELNYFLAYQYCRSLGLQLASFETREKADTMTQYLKNAGYTKYDFWTSGNKLGTDMFLWMSTGLPFNATFDYMLKGPGNRAVDVPPGTEPQRVARESGDSGSADGCVAMIAPSLQWEAQDCTLVKDFICEQTRCYYYNYGSIPVSANQGNRRPYVTTTAAPAGNHKEKEDEEKEQSTETPKDFTVMPSVKTEIDQSDEEQEPEQVEDEEVQQRELSDPILNRIATVLPMVASRSDSEEKPMIIEKSSRPEHIPDIASLFADTSVKSRKDSVFEGLETHEIRSLSRSSANSPVLKMEHREDEVEEENKDLVAHTIGPYDSTQEQQQDYQNDQAEVDPPAKEQDEDSSTILPEAEPAYRYNIKVRSNGKVLEPPSK